MSLLPISMTLSFTLYLYTHITWYFLMILLSWVLYVLYRLWVLICDFHIFMENILVYSLLEGFRTNLQFYHITSCGILHLVEFFKHIIFSNLSLKTPTHSRAVGWATMPYMLIIKNLFKHVHEMGGRKYELYTCPLLCFQLVSQLIFILYTHICFYICMLQLQTILISIGI